ncbi:MAG: hypothetical protein Fur003_4040 [Candidatus Dojkabacteria bacterium]
MNIDVDSKKYADFRILTNKLGIMCDGEAHILSAHLINNVDLIEFTLKWDKLTYKHPELFDQFKGINADKVLEDTQTFEVNLRNALLELDLHIRFMQVPKSIDEIKKDLVEKGGVANLTVKIMDNPPSGHVVTIWESKEALFIHDPNIPEVLSLNEEQIKELFNSSLMLTKNYFLSYDKAFPIERIY